MVWLALGLTPVSQFRSADGLRHAVIFRRADGTFGFASERREEVDGELVWSPCGDSGIYGTYDLAEHAALAELPWLVNVNAN